MPGDSLPTAEMLWETDDPGHVLAHRFGHRDTRSVLAWLSVSLRHRWGLHLRGCERLVLSDTNALAWLTTSRGPVIAKWSVAPQRFARLHGVAELTAWLDARGLPVSAPLPSMDGRLQVETGDVSLSLQRVVAGELLDVDDLGQVHAAGRVLARLHRALADYPDADRLAPPDDHQQTLAARVLSWLDSAGEHVPEVCRSALRVLVADAPAVLPATQAVHGDFRSSNVLCAAGDVAAVIDFEEIRRDHCVSELARSAVMLGTRYRGWGPVTPAVRSAFLAGYEAVRRLTAAEAAWWDLLVLWYSVVLLPRGDDPTGWTAAAMEHREILARRAGG